MKIKLISFLAAGFFALGLSASTEEDFDVVDENGELVLSEENSELLFGKLRDLLGSAADKVGDILNATKNMVKAGFGTAKDLADNGFHAAADLVKKTGLTEFVIAIPLKVAQAGESAIIEFLLEASKSGLKAVGGALTSGITNAIGGALGAQ